MSIDVINDTMNDPMSEVAAPPVAVSMKEKLAARRALLQEQRTHVLAIPGYDDLIAGRYRSLDYRALRKIGDRNGALKAADAELANYADTLINACVELLRVEGDDPEAYPPLRDDGVRARWNAQTAREFFDVEDLPADATARQALLAVIPGTQLALHFQAYDEWLSDVTPRVQEEMRGESEPSQEG